MLARALDRPGTAMALSEPDVSILNADSYQYLAEDVAHLYFLEIRHPVRRGGNRG